MRFAREDSDDEDDMDNFMDEDYENIISQQNALEGFHLHILENNLKAKILAESLKLCRNNLLWIFYSQKSKVKKIKEAYNGFIEILEMKE
jgi:hypothetical protein